MIELRGCAAAFLFVLFLAGCAASPPPPPPPPQAATPGEVGLASWYKPDNGKYRTATGEAFNGNALTAASRTLPLNSMARVTNLANGRSVVLRINDRGPYAKERIIDVSAGAARALGIGDRGVAHVRVEPVDAQTAMP